VAYYFVDADSNPAGWASIEVDTLPGRTGFRIREQYDVRLPGLGEAGHVETRGETWLNVRAELDSLTRTLVRGADTNRIRAVVRADSLTWEDSGDSWTRPLVEGVPLQTTASWPLRFAAGGGASEGTLRRVTLLDPVSGGIRDVDFAVMEQDSRTFADSADTDPDTGEWFVAGTDSVSAWRLEGGSGSGVTWVDQDGRILEAALSGSLRLRRTAFELAFFREGEGGP
jgi:hypothetical protein